MVGRYGFDGAMSRQILCADARLNVLFIAGYDSTNHAYVELIRELSGRGHRCTVLVERAGGDVNNAMFAGADIPVTPLASFPADTAGDYDIAFSGPFIRRPLRRVFDAIAREEVLLVSMAALYSAVTMRVPADLVITMSEDKFAEFADNGLDYNFVAIGNPQYDPLVRARDRWRTAHGGAIRDVLVVDQGAYPLGETGKRQLADTLTAIARNNPEVTFRVKPRYLPGEPGDHLHNLSDHLFSYLDDAPDNLELIRGPAVIEELALEHDAMIALWSTSHLAAAALGMPLLLIGGLDSVDVFDVRRQRVAWAYDRLRATGCVVDFRELAEGPCPFFRIDPDYVCREFYDLEPAAPRIADLLERVGDRLLARGLTLGRGVRGGFAEVMEAIPERVETLSRRSETARIDRRLYRRINAVFQDLVFENRCMGHALDLTRLSPYWRVRLPEGAGVRDADEVVARLRRDANELKAGYFASHAEEVADDPFIQDQYFDWLLDTGRGTELLSYAGPVAAPESLAFDRGVALLKRGRPFSAARSFVDSFRVSLTKPVRLLRKDKNVIVILDRTDRSLLAHAILFFLDRYRAYDALASVEVPSRSGFEPLLYRVMRALVKLGRIDEAKERFRRFREETAPAGGAARGRLPLRLSNAVHRRLLVRYARRIGAS